MESVEPLFRQLCMEIDGLQLILVVLPGKTPVYGKYTFFKYTILYTCTRMSTRQLKHLVIILE